MRHISLILANGPFAPLMPNDTIAEAFGIKSELQRVRDIEEFWAGHGAGSRCPVDMCRDCLEKDANGA